jgi:N-[(2S)-2-amino-2-carboxyethyl]-L-glutamate dehydrogenase
MENGSKNKDAGSRNLVAFSAPEIASVLDGRELEILDVIRRAYQAHGKQKSVLPHSTFIYFPGNAANRIIALPAYLGGEVDSAGVKWIASFPSNLEHGFDRASAVLILNSTATGRPKAIMEGSIISARRTAASAALAAQILDGNRSSVAGIIGCGLINFEIVRFLLLACPRVSMLLAYDINHERAQSFREQCSSKLGFGEVKIVESIHSVLSGASLISFATTAGTPYLTDVSGCRQGAVILHISLRDLSPQVILASDNIVDDIDHVCRARTSVHLAEQQAGNRDFISCTLPDILNGIAPANRGEDKLTVFSPFGLGILDLALGEYVFQRATQAGMGSILPSFFPEPWNRIVAVSA